MTIIKTVFVSLISMLFLSFQTAYINKPVVYLFNDFDKEFEIESQAIYGEKVVILEKDKDYYFVESEDKTVRAYVHKDHLIETDYRNSPNIRPTKSLMTHLYKTDDTSPFPPILTVPFGTLLKLEKLEEEPKRWIGVELVDGTKAYVQKGDIDFYPRKLSIDEMIALSKKFMGLPYVWGGDSSFGYDCSGFVKMLYAKMGVQLPRNSGQQAKSDLLYSVEKKDLVVGDLLFFGNTRVTHIGIYVGDNKFIHSTVNDLGPKVTISDLNTTQANYLFSKRLKPSL